MTDMIIESCRISASDLYWSRASRGSRSVVRIAASEQEARAWAAWGLDRLERLSAWNALLVRIIPTADGVDLGVTSYGPAGGGGSGRRVAG